MILAQAVLIGLLLAGIRFRRETFRRLAAIPIRSAWLLLLAVLLQVPFLRLPPGPLQGFSLQQGLFVGTFILLLIFVWLNRTLLGMLVAGLGLLANLAVIALNGGAMPIAPETLVKINPGSSFEQWVPGDHYDHSKDIIRLSEETRLPWLSDRLAMTVPLPIRAAFSLGDLFIALGIILILQDIRTPKIGQRNGADHET
jgi:hypothetical protein